MIVRKKRREHFVHYGYIPGFGFFLLLWSNSSLIGGFSKSGTMLLRQVSRRRYII